MRKNKSVSKKAAKSKPAKILSPERKDLISRLKERKWFRNSDAKIKKELLSLPEDFNGFLLDMANRAETIGNVDVLRLVKLARGNYQIISVFEVRSILTNEKFTYEYFSWKYGRYPGYRGLILVEVDGQIKFFIIKRGQKFAVANQVYDAIGTVDPSYHENKLINLPTNVKNQLRKLLGINDLNFDKFIDLGVFNPDPAATNNHTALFSVVINVSDAKTIEKQIEGKQFRTLAPGFELEIHPIERLSEFVVKSDDSFFLAIVARLAAKGIVEL